MRSRMLSAMPRDISGAMVACGFPECQTSTWLVLDEAALSFGAPNRAAENPQRKGKQHAEKTEQNKQRLGDLAQSMSFEQDLSNALKAVRCGKKLRNVAEFWTGVFL